MSYLAIGGRYPGGVDLVDGYRVIAQVYSNRIEVRSAYMGGRLIRSRVIPFPDAAPRSRAGRPASSGREGQTVPELLHRAAGDRGVRRLLVTVPGAGLEPATSWL